MPPLSVLGRPLAEAAPDGPAPRPPGARRSSSRSSARGEFDPPDVLAGTARASRSTSRTSPTVVPIPSYFGFQAPGYKYVEYKTGEKELYVASDPYELTNVAAKVAPAIGASLAAYLNRFDGCVGDACRAAEALAPPALLTADFTVTPPALRAAPR